MTIDVALRSKALVRRFEDVTEREVREAYLLRSGPKPEYVPIDQTLDLLKGLTDLLRGPRRREESRIWLAGITPQGIEVVETIGEGWPPIGAKPQFFEGRCIKVDRASPGPWIKLGIHGNEYMLQVAYRAHFLRAASHLLLADQV